MIIDLFEHGEFELQSVWSSDGSPSGWAAEGVYRSLEALRNGEPGIEATIRVIAFQGPNGAWEEFVIE